MQSKEIQQNAQDIENERLQGYEDVLDEYIGGGTKKSMVSFIIKLDQDSEAIKEFFNSYEIIIEAEEGMTCEEWFNSSYKEKSEQELKSILKNQSEPFYWHWADDILGDGDEALVLTNGGAIFLVRKLKNKIGICLGLLISLHGQIGIGLIVVKII